MSAKILFFSIILISFLPLRSHGAEVTGPDVRIINNEIVINTGLSMDEKGTNDLKRGISKEITFYIDLFKVWNIWPDEFIAGKKIVRTLKSDPIKKEYIATSFDGATIIEKRFRDLESMLNWTMNIRNFNLVNIMDIETASYFVRVSIESRIRKLPPVIGYLLFFVPENDFKITKDSPVFRAGVKK